ncbi:ubiquitin-conjugating enzyme [Saitoella complicata NRRL Y-17804]|uniref:ubiquitin-conjugating enzyme n=1 Tax=Saitoella complicata (strain BCRC 22490 / CBS 7301 / JCM 7358 / NBRC 10748 / NRRL Y-17804) TaxID=698492 RepID=UPI000867C75E|nr:ubiquitin-conjugating enzyme [Saitoella complicata NRRL Y-17804]ODQ52683.1 ubiquitin-conjugating enzyme [Saitoella complicata NRRL Y-17804]
MALSSQALKRLSKEYLDTLRQPPDPLLLHLAPISPDDLTQWTATIAPPAHTLYHPGYYTLSITLPPTYPLTPPTISFTTRIAHPNVAFKTGEICLDVLKEAWTPAWGVRSACLAVVGLLESPGWESPLDVDLAVLWRSGEEVGYEGLVRYYVGRYACGHLDSKEGPDGEEEEEP